MNTRPRLSRFLSLPVIALFAAGSLASVPASASSKPAVDSGKEVELVPVVGAAKERLRRSLLGKGDQGFGTMHHECPGGSPHVQSIACGATVSEALTQNGSCVL